MNSNAPLDSSSDGSSPPPYPSFPSSPPVIPAGYPVAPYSSPPPPYAYSPPPGYTPRPARLGIIVGVSIGIAIIVVLSVLLVAGVIPLGPTGPSGPQTYGQAYSAAIANASRYPGGPWKVVVAAGIAPGHTINTTLNSTVFSDSALGGLGRGCALHLNVANGTALSLDSFRGSLGSGEATGWIFGILGEGGVLLLVLDNDGAIEAIGNL
ncbi:MAG: hypothetical protein ACREC5_05980, partial [Thermoplasmata archaeon]